MGRVLHVADADDLGTGDLVSVDTAEEEVVRWMFGGREPRLRRAEPPAPPADPDWLLYALGAVCVAELVLVVVIVGLVFSLLLTGRSLSFHGDGVPARGTEIVATYEIVPGS